MKIAIVTLYNPFEKINGGIESVVYSLSKSLAKCGNEIWVLTMGDVENETITNHDGVNLWIIPDRGYKGLFLRSLIFIKEGRRIVRKMNKIYGINIFNGQAGHSAPLIFARIKGNITLTVHTVDGENFADIKDYWRNNKYRQLLTEIIKYPMIKVWRLFYFLNSDNLIFVSNAAFNEFKKFYPFLDNKKSVVIYNGCPNKITTVEDEIKKEYDFIYAGRIDRRKGVDLIIKAAFLLKSEIKKLSIIIVGDGPWKKDCIELVKRYRLDNNIIFTGYITDYIELLTCISKSKFLILPSFYESDPLIIKEAYQLGVPVIVSDIESLKDRNINGYMFRSGDCVDLYKTMVIALGNKDLKIYLDNDINTWDEIAKKYIEFWGVVQ